MFSTNIWPLSNSFESHLTTFFATCFHISPNTRIINTGNLIIIIIIIYGTWYSAIANILIEGRPDMEGLSFPSLPPPPPDISPTNPRLLSVNNEHIIISLDGARVIDNNMRLQMTRV